MYIFRNSIRSLKNNRGVEAMRELWQQTGMITNGRKLLVDSLSEEEETDLQNKQHNHRKYPKRYLYVLPMNLHMYVRNERIFL